MPVETSQRHKIPLSICFHEFEEETVEDDLQKEKKKTQLLTRKSEESTRNTLGLIHYFHSTYLFS